MYTSVLGKHTVLHHHIWIRKMFFSCFFWRSPSKCVGMDLLLCMPSQGHSVKDTLYPYGVLQNAIKFPLFPLHILQNFWEESLQEFWDLGKSQVRYWLLIDYLYFKFFHKTTVYLPNLPHSLVLNCVKTEELFFDVIWIFSFKRLPRPVLFSGSCVPQLFFFRGDTASR